MSYTLYLATIAFSLEDQNPLLNITTIEGAHLNSFVHPCFNAFLWYIANIHYEYGEITLKKHVNKNHANGVGYMIDANKHQLIYVEGTRPTVKDDKEITDLEKTMNNLKNMFAEIVKETIKNRRRLPKTLYLFGSTGNFELNVNLGVYRLNEVDNTNLP
nr:14032_t:CDS:2 [Entrophospora candida]